MLFQGEGRKEGRKVKEGGGGKVEKGRKDISEVR